MYLSDGRDWSTSLVRPPKRLSWGRRDMLATLVAYVCLNCGNAKLYVDDLAMLRAAVQEQPERFSW